MDSHFFTKKEWTTTASTWLVVTNFEDHKRSSHKRIKSHQHVLNKRQNDKNDWYQHISLMESHWTQRKCWSVSQTKTMIGTTRNEAGTSQTSLNLKVIDDDDDDFNLKM